MASTIFNEFWIYVRHEMKTMVQHVQYNGQISDTKGYGLLLDSEMQQTRERQKLKVPQAKKEKEEERRNKAKHQTGNDLLHLLPVFG